MILSEKDAIECVKDIAEKNGWAWVEPIEITWHPNWFGKRGKWKIMSNANGLGAKIRVVVDTEGQVLEQGYVAR